MRISRELLKDIDKVDGYKDAEELITVIRDKITVRDTISACDYHTVGLKKDGTLVAVGDNEYDQCDVGDWKDIKLP